jgi:hypothetical protein
VFTIPPCFPKNTSFKDNPLGLIRPPYFTEKALEILRKLREERKNLEKK